MTDVLVARKEIEAEVEGRTLVDALADTAEQFADTPAYSDKIGVDGPGWRTLTWAQVRETALDGAAGLVALGVQPGDTVAIMATNRIEHLLADIAGVHAAAIPMSVYNTLSPEQVAFVAGHAEPSVVFLEGADQLARWGRAIEESATPACGRGARHRRGARGPVVPLLGAVSPAGQGVPGNARRRVRGAVAPGHARAARPRSCTPRAPRVTRRASCSRTAT